MAHLIAIVLADTPHKFNQVINSEFLDNHQFDGHLDVSSLTIGGQQFGSVLNNPNAIQDFIKKIEEQNAANFDLDVYVAYMKLFGEENSDFAVVDEGVQSYFKAVRECKHFHDPLKDFALEMAREFLDKFKHDDLNEGDFNELEENFNYEKYQDNLFKYEYKHIQIHDKVYFFQRR